MQPKPKPEGREILLPQVPRSLPLREMRLFALEAKAIDARIVVHRVNPPVGHGQAAEVDPGCHGVAALVEHLARFGIERIQDGILGVLASLDVGQQFLPDVKDGGSGGLVRVFPSRQSKHHSVGDDDRKLGALVETGPQTGT